MTRLIKTFVLMLTVFSLHAVMAAEPIRVGVTASLTGDYAELGRNQLNGIQMWADDLNDRGALLGSPVKIVHYDDGSDPDRSAALYEQLINVDRVDLLLGPYSSDITYAASAIAELHDFPMVATGAAAEKIWAQGFRNVFQIDAPAGRYMDLPLQFASEQGLTRVGLVYGDGEFPVGVMAGARSKAAALGMTIVFDEPYPLGTSEFAAIAGRLRQADPEVLLGGTYLEDSIALVQAAKAADLSPKVFAMTVGPSQRAFGNALGADAAGIMGVVAWFRSGYLPMAYDFSYRYKRKFGFNAAAPAAYGYGGGQTLEAAARLAGSLDKDAVREQLATMKYRSLLGHYRVDETGLQTEKTTYVMQWQKGYRLLVLPEDLKDSPVQFPFVPWSQR